MSELYYAEMEATRNMCIEAYFIARPRLDTPDCRAAFKAGYERAFSALWKEPSAPSADTGQKT